MNLRYGSTLGVHTRRFLRAIVSLVIIAALASIAGVYWRTSTLIHDTALSGARSFADLIVTTRSWNAAHGGVWVAKQPGVTTNPFLLGLGISADATTTEGTALTLRNPAVMTTEISARLRSAGGASFRLTSLDPVDPANAPDDWEAAALASFTTGRTETWETLETSAGPALRYMRPLMTEQACLECHGVQGYRVGDVRGGISVTVPLTEVNRQAAVNALLLAMLGLGATTMLVTATLSLTRRLRTDLELAQAALVEAATVDPLTKLSNRQHTLERLREEIERSRRSGDPLGLVMFDIDHFKNVNDTLGHAAGDAVLRSVAERGLDETRPYDVLGRVGGEEFLLVAPGTDVEGTEALAERARARIAETPIASGDRTVNVTASFGVTVVDAQEADALDRAIARADAALYAAKDAGRDRVRLMLPAPGE